MNTISECRKCAFCCSYVAIEINRPKTKGEYDNLKWIILHKNTEIFVCNRKWFVRFYTPCKFITEDNLCALHKKRTKFWKRAEICNNYSLYKTQECEFYDKNYFDKEFTNVRDIEKLER